MTTAEAQKQSTLDAVRAASDPKGLMTEAVSLATGGASTTVTPLLGKLRKLEMVTSSGAGTKGDPLVWRAVTTFSSRSTTLPTSDPAYVKYLDSKEWADRRAERTFRHRRPLLLSATVRGLTLKRAGPQSPGQAITARMQTVGELGLLSKTTCDTPV